jgi:ESCRT-II complex subunit VPS36
MMNTNGAGGGALSWNSRDAGLSCHVTNHRIVLIDERDSTAIVGGSIPLPLVESFGPAGGPSIRSPFCSYKINLNTHQWGVLTIVFKGGETGSYSESRRHRDDVLAAIQTAMNRDAWNEKARQAAKEANRPSNQVDGMLPGLNRLETIIDFQSEFASDARVSICTWNISYALLRPSDQENAHLVDVAFGTKMSKKVDIDAFLRDAEPLKKIIDSNIAKIERSRPNESVVNDTDKLVGMLENMGITSALSKKQAGSTYHKQLARQLVDFLRHDDKLTKAGGMMTLTDVYCLFNRARGTNMIAPEDLLKAVDLTKDMNLGISKRLFSSGVVVIQADEFDDNIIGKKLAKLASISMEPQSQNPPSSLGGITVMDVCRALKISALLANEQLLTTEQMGLLCRDSTIEGVRFFPNLFATGAEQRLVAVQSDDIGIEDTMLFRREMVLKKRELGATAGHFSREEST